ncbi:hypothetical protein KPL47_06725 [Clostridium estertheticum]|uniref:hypothetical protein n=1 Tax=Clostridium estertheticum TaxID=238834 RepID=UPI001C0B4EAD|nr:hypothetical protein [Clostridium estertheticum]MBU3176060.1 hypothetical protein [Clostridium estertheticum]
MTAAKTRCKHCVNVEKEAVKHPCNICNEIQPKFRFKENHFLDTSKNLITGVNSANK